MLKRDDYRKVKQMNKEQLNAYLEKIWYQGYDAGLKAQMAKRKSKEDDK